MTTPPAKGGGGEAPLWVTRWIVEGLWWWSCRHKVSKPNNVVAWVKEGDWGRGMGRGLKEAVSAKLKWFPRSGVAGS